MKTFVLLLCIILTSGLAIAEGKFTKMASGKPDLIQSGPSKMWCPVCGMNLKKFYKTSHGVVLDDGQKKQYCSIRCLVVDHEHTKGHVQKTLVVDAAKEKLIDALQATYVVGGKAMGTMTKISKFAFGTASAAEDFQNKFGGQLMTFQEAAASATASLSKDIAMTDKKRKAKMYPMGKKLYSKKCQKIDVHQYARINLIKADLKTKKLCGDIKEKQMQAVALYLWDVVRLSGKNAVQTVEVGNHEKCPVCGMFVYKYPKWAARLNVARLDRQEHFSFDGVKDLMKFYFEPEKWGSPKGLKFGKVWVTDYYTQKAIDGKKAFYVVGSNVLGPMGNELIPFETQHDAATFNKDHLGTAIYTFDQITKEGVYRLDE